MKLKQLFCRHKKLTAVGIYEHITHYFDTTWSDVRIICKCDKCNKEFEFKGKELQYLRHAFIKYINIDKVFNHELWGKWW